MWYDSFRIIIPKAYIGRDKTQGVGMSIMFKLKLMQFQWEIPLPIKQPPRGRLIKRVTFGKNLFLCERNELWFFDSKRLEWQYYAHLIKEKSNNGRRRRIQIR